MRHQSDNQLPAPAVCAAHEQDVAKYAPQSLRCWLKSQAAQGVRLLSLARVGGVGTPAAPCSLASLHCLLPLRCPLPSPLPQSCRVRARLRLRRLTICAR